LPDRLGRLAQSEAASLNNGRTDMPVINANGCSLHVEVEGPDNAPVLILSNSLGTTLHMWDGQVGPFTEHFRLVRFDRRGHGKSGLAKRPYSMEMLGRDVLAIMDGLGIQKANWCGLSMGGMEGMWLGANAPQRFERLVLSNTSSYFPDKKAWNDRIALIREKGVPAFAAPNMERWFTKSFREREPQAIARMMEMFSATELEGYIACAEAVRDMDHRALLPNVKVPTLVIIGRHDPATTPEAGEFIRNNIPGAEHFMIDAAHISNIEQPQQFNEAVLTFLTRR
jgi:3-oxoadipate enol-lactonase